MNAQKQMRPTQRSRWQRCPVAIVLRWLVHRSQQQRKQVRLSVAGEWEQCSSTALLQRSLLLRKLLSSTTLRGSRRLQLENFRRVLNFRDYQKVTSFLPFKSLNISMSRSLIWRWCVFCMFNLKSALIDRGEAPIKCLPEVCSSVKLHPFTHAAHPSLF